MRRPLLIFLGVILLGALRIPVERALAREFADLGFHAAPLNMELREQVGHLGFVAALSGFRSVVADVFFLKAHLAWERTEWSRVLLSFRRATALQPRAVLFWDMAAWHMAWNASAAALHDPHQPRFSERLKTQRQYFDLGRDFLERGLRSNPGSAQLHDALGRLFRDKYQDHLRASEAFLRASQLPGAASYLERFSAYELSRVEGHEEEAHRRLRGLYDRGEQERAPTLITRLKVLEKKLNVPPPQRIPDPAPRPHP